MAKAKSSKKNHEANEKEAKEKLVSAVPTMPEADGMPAETVPVTSRAVTASEPRSIMPRKNANKPEIVKTESRSNLVPISIEDEIRQLAYLFSERRGFTPGHETEDWLAAEHEVLERYHHTSAQQARA